MCTLHHHANRLTHAAEVCTAGRLIRTCRSPICGVAPAEQLELRFWNTSNQEIGGRSSGTGVLDMVSPPGSLYALQVISTAAYSGSLPFTYRVWYVSAAASGNMAITSAPDTAVPGGSGNILLAFSGLSYNQYYLGKDKGAGEGRLCRA